METNEKIQLSVLDIEKKYIVTPDEYTYGGEKMVAWGVDNNLPVLYRNCYQQSATLKSVIDGTINYILGDDVIVNDSAAYWAKEVNRRGLTMRSLISKLAYNYLVYGGFAIQVIYNGLGLPVELFPLDFGRCRTNENGTKVWYAKKWSKYQTKGEEFDIYDPEKLDKDKLTQIYYYKGDTTSSIYPLPPYQGAIYDILTEIECAKYSLNTVARGFSAKYLIQFPETANLTDEQKEGIEEAIKTKFCGSETDSNFMLYWKTAAEGIEINKLESDETPERYIAIKDNARANIFISLRCTPLLFGLPNAANGFSTQEYSDSYKLFVKSVVAPIQDTILGAIEKITGAEDAVTITPFNIEFETQE